MMNFRIIDGKHLEGEEKEEKLSLVYDLDKFKEIVNQMRKSKDFDPTTLLPKKVYAFTLNVKDGESQSVLNSTIVHLTDEEEKVSIIYKELPRGNDALYGHVVTNSNTAIKHIMDLQGNIELESVNVAALNANDDENDLPNNADYNKDEAVVSTQFWVPWNDCLPGGYQHCGPGCGYYSSKGGKAPINRTDWCCVYHDSCYHSGAKSKKCCDKDLINCTANHNTVASAAISYYFSAPALLC